MNWLHRVKLKHLFTEQEDHESIKKSMADIAEAIKNEKCFFGFNIKRFYKIPEGDDIIGPVDYANKLMSRLYDFADNRKIWIE